mgnify:FL=1
MNEAAAIGHNNPPDPIDAICADFEGIRMEAENWLDGQEVTDETQMKAVDEIRKGAREFRMALEAGQKSATAPLYDAYKAESARWKPTVEDAQRIEKGLVGLVDAFKRKLAVIKAEAERKAREEANAARRAAERAAREADASNIEAQRAAAQAQFEADEAQRRAAAASKDTVKGLRTFDVTEVIDGTAYARWLWQNDREPLLAWMNDHARRCKHHVPGVVETRKERRAV